jgi:4-amino-4-deoxychorismate lyase
MPYGQVTMSKPRVLSKGEAVAALHDRLPPSAPSFLAFYSSALGGIVTDPSVFVVPLDEHMVHRGHAGK